MTYRQSNENTKTQNRIVFRCLRSAHKIIPNRRDIKVKISADK